VLAEVVNNNKIRSMDSTGFYGGFYVKIIWVHIDPLPQAKRPEREFEFKFEKGSAREVDSE